MKKTMKIIYKILVTISTIIILLSLFANIKEMKEREKSINNNNTVQCIYLHCTAFLLFFNVNLCFIEKTPLNGK